MIDPVLLRHPVTDGQGLITPPWARQQSQVTAAANKVATVEQMVSSVLASASFDDRNPVDFSPAIQSALLEDQSSAQRDFSPAIQEAQLSLSQEASAQRDFSPGIQDAQLSLSQEAPRVYDDSELRNAIAGLDAPNLSLQQQLDEVRALLAAGDAPQLTNLGFSWTTFVPATMGAAGSMTVSSVTYGVAKYYSVGNLCYLRMQITFTLGGTASGILYVYPPLTPAQSNDAFACILSNNGGAYQSAVCFTSGTALQIQVSGGANFALGASSLMITGFFAT